MIIFYKNKINNNKAGFVLLFSVILTAIVLAITIGVSDIALKEVVFVTSAKDSNEAFYAADTGVECALYYDRTLIPLSNPNAGTGAPVYVFGIPTEDVITACNGVFIALNEDAEGDESSTGPWVFELTSLGSEQQACALVEVSKVGNQTIITSKGYNFGHIEYASGDPNFGHPNCDSNNRNQVKRVIEVRY